MSDGSSFNSLPMSKYIPLVVLQVVSSCLSIISSIIVIRISRSKLQSAYQRLVLAMTLSAILTAVVLIIQPFFVPSSTSSSTTDDWAVGNASSCTAIGFLLVFATLCLALYSIMLALYFYFSIQTDQNPKRQQQRPKQTEDVIGWPERLGHMFCWIAPAVLAGAGIGLDHYRHDPTINMCILVKDGDDEEEEEGLIAGGILRQMYQWTLFGSVIVSIVITLIIQLQVRGALKKISTETANENEDERHREDLNPDNDDDEQQQMIKQKFSAVAIQCGLYTSAYSVCSVFFVVLLFLPTTDNPDVVYSFQILTAVIYPFIGVLNCIIYVRPRVQMLRIMYPQDPYLMVLRVGMSTAGDAEEIEHIRAELYGSDYGGSGSHMIYGGDDGGGGGGDGGVSVAESIGTIPSVVHVNTDKPVSVKSLVSTPGGGENDDDRNDNMSTVSPIADPEFTDPADDIENGHEVETGGLVVEKNWKRVTPVGLQS